VTPSLLGPRWVYSDTLLGKAKPFHPSHFHHARACLSLLVTTTKVCSLFSQLPEVGYSLFFPLLFLFLFGLFQIFRGPLPNTLHSLVPPNKLRIASLTFFCYDILFFLSVLSFFPVCDCPLGFPIYWRVLFLITDRLPFGHLIFLLFHPATPPVPGTTNL